MGEPLDRNKTALTHVSTATTAAWLANIGCKPIEAEVSLASGWCADLAAWWTPSMTEAKRARLIRDLLPDEPRTESYDAMARLSRTYGGRLTVLVEVKTSRADFMADLGRKYGTFEKRATMTPPAHLCVVAAPAGVLPEKAGERLDAWGHLQLSADGTRVVKWRGPWNCARLHPGEIEDFIAAVAVRQYNVIHYGNLRRWLKAYRANQHTRRPSGSRE